MLRLKDSLLSNNRSLKKSFVYEGRASREDFFLFIYFNIIFTIFNIVLFAATGGLFNLLPDTASMIAKIILGLPLVVYYIGLPFAFASLSARRLHDLGMGLKSWYLLPFVSHKMGSKEPNAWGESPRA